jgi:hypothetical protein
VYTLPIEKSGKFSSLTFQPPKQELHNFVKKKLHAPEILNIRKLVNFLVNENTCLKNIVISDHTFPYIIYDSFEFIEGIDTIIFELTKEGPGVSI